MINKEEKINKFIDLVLEENEKFNLTAVTNKEEFKNRHIVDSLFPSKVFDFENKYIMDLGSGAGFPGIPLAIYFPSSKFVLVEPIAKRCEFLERVKVELELNNVEIVNKRVEDLSKENKFDIVVTRAVSSLNILLELSIPYLKVGGMLIAYKGKKAQKEIKEASGAFKQLSCHVEDEQIDKEGENIIRYNLFIKKDKETDLRYPRNYSQIKKKPL